MLPPLVVILALTLVPDPSAGEPPPYLCLLCDRRALADALLNVALFVPLGLALAAAGLGWLATLLLGTALTTVIELTQTWVPGRVSSSGDLLTNMLGTGAGWVLFRTGAAFLATPRRRAALAWAAAALAPVAITVTGVLLAPAWPDSRWTSEWTPEPEAYPGYDGTLHAVRLGAAALPDAPLGAASAGIAARLRAGEPLTIHGTAGSAPLRAVPIFRIQDQAAREVVLVAAHRDAAYVRFRTRAAALLLDQPELRLDGALGAAPEGGPLLIEWRPDGRRFCMRVNAAASCELRYTAADGWRLLLNPPALPTRARTVIGALWLLALAAPAGLLAPRRPPAALRRAAVIAAGVAAALLNVDTLVLTALDAVALAAGFVAGYAAADATRRLGNAGYRGGMRPAEVRRGAALVPGGRGPAGRGPDARDRAERGGAG